MLVSFYEVASHEVDSHHGIYSAQIFAQMFPFETLEGISKEDYDILLFGPDHEEYTDIWAELDQINVTDKEGVKWGVYENEGIYLYPLNVEIDWSELANE